MVNSKIRERPMQSIYPYCASAHKRMYPTRGECLAASRYKKKKQGGSKLGRVYRCPASRHYHMTRADQKWYHQQAALKNYREITQPPIA